MLRWLEFHFECVRGAMIMKKKLLCVLLPDLRFVSLERFSLFVTSHVDAYHLQFSSLHLWKMIFVAFLFEKLKIFDWKCFFPSLCVCFKEKVFVLCWWIFECPAGFLCVPVRVMFFPFLILYWEVNFFSPSDDGRREVKESKLTIVNL